MLVAFSATPNSECLFHRPPSVMSPSSPQERTVFSTLLLLLCPRLQPSITFSQRYNNFSFWPNMICRAAAWVIWKTSLIANIIETHNFMVHNKLLTFDTFIGWHQDSKRGWSDLKMLLEVPLWGQAWPPGPKRQIMSNTASSRLEKFEKWPKNKEKRGK